MSLANRTSHRWWLAFPAPVPGGARASGRHSGARAALPEQGRTRRFAHQGTAAIAGDRAPPDVALPWPERCAAAYPDCLIFVLRRATQPLPSRNAYPPAVPRGPSDYHPAARSDREQGTGDETVRYPKHYEPCDRSRGL